MLAIRLHPHLLSGFATHLYRLLGDSQLCGLRLHCWRLRDRTSFLELLFGSRLASHLPLCPPLGLARPSGRLGQLSPLNLTTPSICGPSTFKNPDDQTIERARRSRGHETAPRVCRVTQGGPFRGHWFRRSNTAIRHNSRERRQRKQAHTREEGACHAYDARRGRCCAWLSQLGVENRPLSQNHPHPAAVPVFSRYASSSSQSDKLGSERLLSDAEVIGR